MFGNIFKKEEVKKTELEQVEDQKDEYKLIGNYIRTKGLMLFAYNSIKDELNVVKIDKRKDIAISFVEGKLKKEEVGDEECTVDSRNIHFEALNMKSATKRLNKYKSGKIKELCNLRNPDEMDTLSLY